MIQRVLINRSFPFLEKFGDDIQVAKITNEQEALTAASEAYEIKNEKRKNYKSYMIFYDEEHQSYLICYVSSFQYNTTLGDYNILIREDGRVLAMWSDVE